MLELFIEEGVCGIRTSTHFVDWICYTFPTPNMQICFEVLSRLRQLIKKFCEIVFASKLHTACTSQNMQYLHTFLPTCH